MAIPCNYIYAGKFTEGVAHVTISDSNDEVLIDRTGKITTKLLEKYISDFTFLEGLSVAYAPTGNKIIFE
ncbi:hypothetical protein PNBC_03735 [Paenibacillus crassostreae]|uniref:Uncharacterized protein n=1 Tax=Paenibacillus crassostreae TaxID=1763538 RepID=A0A167FG70_9BACL|nr:hypothetical protein LPB68_21005 [Paenibacillus crassostreae]OAB76528.1 hypothetical protein PNBC_03735 [Paenibacillus crassostreae]